MSTPYIEGEGFVPVQPVCLPLESRYDAAAAVAGIERGLGIKFKINHDTDRGQVVVEATDPASVDALEILPDVVGQVGQLRGQLEGRMSDLEIGQTLVATAIAVSQSRLVRKAE